MASRPRWGGSRIVKSEKKKYTCMNCFCSIAKLLRYFSVTEKKSLDQKYHFEINIQLENNKQTYQIKSHIICNMNGHWFWFVCFRCLFDLLKFYLLQIISCSISKIWKKITFFIRIIFWVKWVCTFTQKSMK